MYLLKIVMSKIFQGRFWNYSDFRLNFFWRKGDVFSHFELKFDVVHVFKMLGGELFPKKFLSYLEGIPELQLKIPMIRNLHLIFAECVKITKTAYCIFAIMGPRRLQ